MIVAIHQPNYLPWLGYFSKIMQSDVFVFLDDVPFSKGSYTNRVKIADGRDGAWLTLPVRQSLGQKINHVAINGDWRRSHLDRLKQVYGRAPHGRPLLVLLEHAFDQLADPHRLALVNIRLIEILSTAIGLETRFMWASQIGTGGDVAADDRLIEIVGRIDPGGTYLSGKGAQAYQSPEKFHNAGLEFRMTDFSHPEYNQSGQRDFIAGFSIVDVIAAVGLDDTRNLLETSSA